MAPVRHRLLRPLLSLVLLLATADVESCTSIGDVSAYKSAARAASRTTKLELNSKNLCSIPKGALDKFTALKHLALHYNRLTSLEVGVFDKNTALTILSLSGNQLTSLKLGVFDKNARLTTLDLAYNRLTSLEAGVFDKNTALTHLYLYNNRLTSLEVGVLDKNTALTTLDSTVLCPPGTSGPGCSPCPPETFQPEQGQMACLDARVCSAGQYESTSLTSTSDRHCAACASGKYQAQANQDSCVNKRGCSAGTYISSEGTTSTDRSCSNCVSGKYQDSANMQSCKNKQTCFPGAYVVSQDTASTDRICSQCSTGKFQTQTNQGSCNVLSTCESGTYISSEGTASTNTVCTGCGEGSYQDETNQKSCKTKKICPPGSYATSPETASTDRTCSPCLSGHFQPASGSSGCLPMTTCVAAQYVSVAGSNTSDRKCAACEPGTFSTESNQDRCRPVTLCLAGSFVVSQPTSMSDRVCSKCSNGTFADHQNAILCTRWSSCDSKVRAGNATSDHLCADASSTSTGGSHILVSAAAAGGVLLALIVAVVTMRRRRAKQSHRNLFVMRGDTPKVVRTAMTTVTNPMYGGHEPAADAPSEYAEIEQEAAVDVSDSGAVYSVPEEVESRERRVGTAWSRTRPSAIQAAQKTLNPSFGVGEPAADAIYEGPEEMDLVEHGGWPVRRGSTWTRPSAVSRVSNANQSVIDEHAAGATYEEPQEVEHGARRGTAWSRPTGSSHVYSLATETLPGMYGDIAATQSSNGVYATGVIQTSLCVDLHVATGDSDGYTPLQADRRVYGGAPKPSSADIASADIQPAHCYDLANGDGNGYTLLQADRQVYDDAEREAHYDTVEADTVEADTSLQHGRHVYNQDSIPSLRLTCDHGSLSRAEANALVLNSGLGQGAFLLRISSSGKRALSVLSRGKVVHHLLALAPEGWTVNGRLAVPPAATVEALLARLHEASCGGGVLSEPLGLSVQVDESCDA